MDNSGDRDNEPRQMSRADYARNVKAAIDERRQRARNHRQQFEPQVHEQIQRLFRDYEAPFHARMRGFGRTQTLALAESTVLSFAAVNGRSLEDWETQALAEHYLSGVHNQLAWKWAMTSLAAYMTYRGRKTWRFPFFTPIITRYSPVGGGPALKFMWHSARFAAYYGTLWVLGEPVFQGANFWRHRSAMMRDPRLKSLLHEGKAQGATLLEGRPEAAGQIGDAWEAAARQEASDQPRDVEPSSQSPQTQSSWANYRTPAQSRPPQRSDSWDSLPDGFDDASPVAQGQHANRTDHRGSSWDRIRQQSTYQPNQHQQGQQSWEKPQSGGGWGSDNAGMSQQSQGSRNSYTLSAADEENNLAKEQAQREFDRLLDKERHGVDQERPPWNKR